MSKDVETTKGDVKELKIGLAGTKLVVKKVSNMVVKHDKQIKKNTEKIKQVNKRVDVVEQDLEETKEKVEEIDMKVGHDLYDWIMLREYQRNQYEDVCLSVCRRLVR